MRPQIIEKQRKFKENLQREVFTVKNRNKANFHSSEGIPCLPNPYTVTSRYTDTHYTDTSYFIDTRQHTTSPRSSTQRPHAPAHNVPTHQHTTSPRTNTQRLHAPAHNVPTYQHINAPTHKSNNSRINGRTSAPTYQCTHARDKSTVRIVTACPFLFRFPIGGFRNAALIYPESLVLN